MYKPKGSRTVTNALQGGCIYRYTHMKTLWTKAMLETWHAPAAGMCPRYPHQIKQYTHIWLMEI